MHYCRRNSHATSRTPIYANITQTGRIRVYCSWFWVVLVRFVGFVGGFGWFWLVLLVVLGGFGWFWVVLGRFGWFRVLVTTCVQVTIRVAAVIEAVIAASSEHLQPHHSI
mgnify:CR=1 FL=1